ncbi:helix-turn-helix domain-containing protein [Sphingomonas sp.]|uniref:helix-turn-helix domain-containing protein n=1 Tax=Sphingomonas sp. TaxID=28214 RepID=UPI003B3A84AE
MIKQAGNAAHPGLALRTARIEQGLTLRALAARTGLPFSTLSKLENGKMAMTYDKLVRLAQGLGVDIGVLVSSTPAVEAPPPGIGRRSILRADTMRPISEQHSHFYPASELLGKMMVPIIIDVKARSVEELGGLVRHGGEEFLYVLHGAMELHSDLYAPLPLDAGDSVYFDSGMAHGYVRTSEAPCRVMSVCAGAGIQRLSQTTDPDWASDHPA